MSKLLDDVVPKVDLPEGTCGRWRIERFVVSEDGARFHNLREAINRERGCRMIEPGTYTRLTRADVRSHPRMSDTPAERWDIYDFVRTASGKVLIAGLGLGVVVNALLRKPEVSHVTVVEIDPDILSLVGQHFFARSAVYCSRLSLVEGDIFTWLPRRASAGTSRGSTSGPRYVQIT